MFNPYRVLIDGRRLAIASHDAGGAEILSSFVRRGHGNCIFALDGPAVAIFERKLGHLPNLAPADAVAAADVLVAGTSSPSDHELSALRFARLAQKPSIAVLDHWINYRARFERQGTLELPHELWVCDEEAAHLARVAFPETRVVQIVNPLRLDMEKEMRAAARYPGTPGLRVLYVTEPTSEHAERRFNDPRHWGYTEQEALSYFLAHLGVLGQAVSTLVVRPHPSELESKYHWIREAQGMTVTVRRGRGLAQEIAEADVIAGCNSMAMVVGTWGAKRVICTIPPGGRGFALPIPGIEQLAELVARGSAAGSRAE